MVNIIEALIEIEQAADKIISGMKEDRLALPAAIQKRVREINDEIEAETEEKIGTIYARAEYNARIAAAAAESELRGRRDGLNEYFEKNHETIENELFDKITGR